MIQRDLPGADIVERGIGDLLHDRESPEALAICAVQGRLRRCGVKVPEVQCERAEIRMYETLASQGEANPHSALNAIMRRIDAYASAAERRGAKGSVAP